MCSKFSTLLVLTCFLYETTFVRCSENKTQPLRQAKNAVEVDLTLEATGDPASTQTIDSDWLRPIKVTPSDVSGEDNFSPRIQDGLPPIDELASTKNNPYWDSLMRNISSRVSCEDGLSADTEPPEPLHQSQWPYSVVPFMVDQEIFDNLTIHQILWAVKRIQDASCIHFKPLTSEEDATSDYLYFTNRHAVRECVHFTTTKPISPGIYRINVVLGFDCLSKRDILHATMHGLGLKDEVTHPKRDIYVRVNWDNIQPKYQPLFQIDMSYAPIREGLEYDTRSVMHFHDRAYSRNGRATLLPRIPGLQILATSQLSQIDKMKLRVIFHHECMRREVSRFVEKCKVAFPPVPGCESSVESWQTEGPSGEEQTTNDASSTPDQGTFDIDASVHLSNEDKQEKGGRNCTADCALLNAPLHVCVC